jgi:hypothetical protein
MATNLHSESLHMFNRLLKDEIAKSVNPADYNWLPTNTSQIIFKSGWKLPIIGLLGPVTGGLRDRD